MADIQHIILQDVARDENPDITLGLVVCQGGADDGLVISTDNHPQRVVIENHQGKLMVHVWATNDSLDNDPTHSIEIEAAGREEIGERISPRPN